MNRGEIVGKRSFGKNLAQERKLYSELYKEFVNQLKIKGRAEQTLISYHYHNKYFMDFLGEDVYCDSITLSTLEDYISYIQDKKKIENGTTINSYLRNVSPVIKYGIRKGYILKDFAIPEVTVQETFKEIYTKDELKVKSVDLLNRTIVLNSTKNKKARIVPISSSFLEVIEEYLNMRNGNSDDYLFCSVYNTMLAMSSLQKSVKIFCNERAIDKTSLHLFRHTFITNAVNKNVSPLILQRITGHSTMKELSRYYNAKTTDIFIVERIGKDGVCIHTGYSIYLAKAIEEHIFLC